MHRSASDFEANDIQMLRQCKQGGFEKQTLLSPGTELENIDVCERWCG